MMTISLCWNCGHYDEVMALLEHVRARGLTVGGHGPSQVAWAMDTLRRGCRIGASHYGDENPDVKVSVPEGVLRVVDDLLSAAISGKAEGFSLLDCHGGVWSMGLRQEAKREWLRGLQQRRDLEASAMASKKRWFGRLDAHLRDKAKMRRDIREHLLSCWVSGAMPDVRRFTCERFRHNEVKRMFREEARVLGIPCFSVK